MDLMEKKFLSKSWVKRWPLPQETLVSINYESQAFLETVENHGLEIPRCQLNFYRLNSDTSESRFSSVSENA